MKDTQDQIQTTQAQVEALNGLTERTPKQDADLEALESRLASLRSTLATFLSLSTGNASNLLTVIEPAVPPTDAISPNRPPEHGPRCGARLARRREDRRPAELLYDGVRDTDAVMDATGLSTLGVISRMKGNRSSSEMYQLAPS